LAATRVAGSLAIGFRCHKDGHRPGPVDRARAGRGQRRPRALRAHGCPRAMFRRGAPRRRGATAMRVLAAVEDHQG